MYTLFKQDVTNKGKLERYDTVQCTMYCKLSKRRKANFVYLLIDDYSKLTFVLFNLVESVHDIRLFMTSV